MALARDTHAGTPLRSTATTTRRDDVRMWFEAHEVFAMAERRTQPRGLLAVGLVHGDVIRLAHELLFCARAAR